jgi:ABC-type oligopeptide transport system substrate-binding subunit
LEYAEFGLQEVKFMKNIVVLICCMIIMGLLLFSAGCKKSENSEHSGEKAPDSFTEKPALDHDEPAPVPEGTPEY